MPVLAYRRNQDIFEQPLDLPTPTAPAYLNYFDTLPRTTSTPSPSEFADKLRQGYFRTPSQLSLSNLKNHNAIVESSKAGADNYTSVQNNFAPLLRLQPPSSSGSNNMANTDFEQPAQVWNMYNSHAAPMSNQALQAVNRRAHNRASSTSSQGSTQSARQFQHRRGNGNASQFSYGANSNFSPPQLYVKPTADESSRSFSNHLPTPSDTPTQDTFLGYNNYNTQPSNMENTLGAHLAMKQALLDQASAGGEEEVPGFSHSGRHSVSSYGQDSPVTPHAGPSDDIEEARYRGNNQSEFSKQIIPKFDRTMTEIYADELFNPSSLAVQQPATSNPQQSQASNAKSSLLSPYRGQLGERLQQANQARSSSPASSVSRGISPFRNGSPYAGVSHSFNNGQAQLMSTDQRDMVNQAFRSQMQSNDDNQPKTISPKDAMLDYRASEIDSKMPLFPEASGAQYNQSFSMAPQVPTNAGQYDISSQSSYSGVTHPGRINTSNFGAIQGPVATQQFNFVPPSIPGGFHSMSFASQPYSSPSRSHSSNEATPDFPAHLTSMDSSASEKDLDGPDGLGVPLHKPVSSLADSGTYTCTYHGCTQRFETPQKLQKHKREGHRQNITAVQTPGIGSGMSPAALLERNSQAGPHKCERINPTTGKPCNTIFSRPYDLTRHEDTIHNGRKQKVRCALCVEEKTFSRNDALTRHMRVVHPEVDFPGKHRRRGGHHD